MNIENEIERKTYQDCKQAKGVREKYGIGKEECQKREAKGRCV